MMLIRPPRVENEVHPVVAQNIIDLAFADPIQFCLLISSLSPEQMNAIVVRTNNNGNSLLQYWAQDEAGKNCLGRIIETCSSAALKTATLKKNHKQETLFTLSQSAIPAYDLASLMEKIDLDNVSLTVALQEKNELDETGIAIFIRQSTTEMIIQLAEKIPTILGKQVNTVAKNGLSGLYYICRKENFALIEPYLKCKLDDSILKTDANGVTPLELIMTNLPPQHIYQFLKRVSPNTYDECLQTKLSGGKSGIQALHDKQPTPEQLGDFIALSPFGFSAALHPNDPRFSAPLYNAIHYPVETFKQDPHTFMGLFSRALPLQQTSISYVGKWLSVLTSALSAIKKDHALTGQQDKLLALIGRIYFIAGYPELAVDTWQAITSPHNLHPDENYLIASLFNHTVQSGHLDELHGQIFQLETLNHLSAAAHFAQDREAAPIQSIEDAVALLNSLVIADGRELNPLVENRELVQEGIRQLTIKIHQSSQAYLPAVLLLLQDSELNNQQQSASRSLCLFAKAPASTERVIFINNFIAAFFNAQNDATKIELLRYNLNTPFCNDPKNVDITTILQQILKTFFYMQYRDAENNDFCHRLDFMTLRCLQTEEQQKRYFLQRNALLTEIQQQPLFTEARNPCDSECAWCATSVSSIVGFVTGLASGLVTKSVTIGLSTSFPIACCPLATAAITAGSTKLYNAIENYKHDRQKANLNDQADKLTKKIDDAYIPQKPMRR